jgi:hypothetical protein
MVKYHKSIIAFLAVLIPGSDFLFEAINKLDLSVILTSDIKFWALAGVVAIMPYLNGKGNKEESIEELKKYIKERKSNG